MSIETMFDMYMLLPNNVFFSQFLTLALMVNYLIENFCSVISVCSKP
jgi:hypothetical protein